MDINEEWRKIIDFPNYEISSLGNVRNAKLNKPMTINRSDPRWLRVRISCEGKATTKRVHRLVAEAFVPNPEGHDVVYHKDGNVENNCCDNLAWKKKYTKIVD